MIEHGRGARGPLYDGRVRGEHLMRARQLQPLLGSVPAHLVREGLLKFTRRQTRRQLANLLKTDALGAQTLQVSLAYDVELPLTEVERVPPRKVLLSLETQDVDVGVVLAVVRSKTGNSPTQAGDRLVVDRRAMAAPFVSRCWEFRVARDPPARSLYRVRFRQADIWPDYAGPPADSVEVEIYEHWLEPA